MENSNRFRTAAIGVLLATFGFMCGYLTNEQPPGPLPPPHPPYAEQAPPPHCGIDRRAMAMGWSSEQPYTTVIVMQDGQPIRIEQSGGPVAMAQNGPQAAASASPEPGKTDSHGGLLLAVLMLSLMPVLTWGALAWNRRKGQTDPFVETDPVYQEFVPRRDD